MGSIPLETNPMTHNAISDPKLPPGIQEELDVLSLPQ